MKDIDIELSEKVAEEASKQMTQLKKDIDENKSAHISLLEDILSDNKEQRKFLKSICVALLVVVFLIALGSFAASVYNQKLLRDMSTESEQKIFDFISNADFNSSVEMTTDNNSENNGSISVRK